MNKKRRYYAIGNLNTSKSGVSDLGSIKKGILMSVTVNSKSLTAFQEVNQILSHYFPSIEQEDSDDIQASNLTVEEEVEKEAKKLKGEKQRFTLIDDISRCLVLIKFNVKNDTPSTMVENLMKIAYEIKTLKTRVSENEYFLSSRFISRLIPLDIICPVKLGEIQKSVKNLILVNFDNAFCSNISTGDEKKIVSWACFYNSRYNGSEIKRQEIYDLVTELIWGTEDDSKYQERKSQYPVNLSAPKKSILIEITRIFCGISIVNNYHRYCRFNLNMISESSGS
ncbi:THUMP RNA binding domain containing protein [Cryptosporidium felis]|nr:THUMP RNA binding domain containing protein [Cryptosporidium felis]